MKNETPKEFYNFIEEHEEAISELHDKYESLVWYSRTDRDRWDIKAVYAKIRDIHKKYPSEIKKLVGENSDWHHGFNSGMLACLRLHDYPLGIIDGLNEFPMLDT